MDLFTLKFEKMYKSHYSSLCNVARNIVSDADAAHDIVQEVFLKLWRRKENLSLIVNLRAYLFRSVINTSLTYLNKNKNKVSIANLKIEAEENSDSNLNVKELEQNINTAIEKLPARCKAIFVLSRFEGVKNREIASMMGLSLKTVENQVGLALKKLRSELKLFFGREFIAGAPLTSIFLLMRFFYLNPTVTL